MLQLQSAFGIFALLAIAWGFGENRRAVSIRQAAVGLAVGRQTEVARIADLAADHPLAHPAGTEALLDLQGQLGERHDRDAELLGDRLHVATRDRAKEHELEQLVIRQSLAAGLSETGAQAVAVPEIMRRLVLRTASP